MATSVPAVKAALYTRCLALYSAPVFVSYGHPGTYKPDDIVAIMDVDASQEMATMSTNRTREETYTITVVFSVFRGGDDQKIATDRAYELMTVLEGELGTDPTITGTCREAELLGHVLAEEVDQVNMGRVAEVSVSVRVRARLYAGT